MPNIYRFSNLIHALDESKGLTESGYTFLDRDQQETFMSWDTLRQEAMRRAAHFRKYGLNKGDRLAMVVPDGEDFVPTFLAAVWAGLVPVPMYPPLSLGKLDSYLDTFVAICSRAEPLYLVTPGKLQQVLWSGAAKVKSLKGIITTEELKEPAPAGASQDPAQVTDDDLCFLQFTSGSTSTPKGVEVTHGSLRANAWAIMRDGLQSEEGRDRGVSWLPLYHDMGLIGFVISPLMHRIPVTFIPTMSFVRGANIWLETISRHKGTITFAPNFAYALAVKRAKPERMKEWDLSQMRVFGCGAEPINAQVMRTFVDTFKSCGLKPEALLPCYGMAEATLAISFIGLDQTLSTDVIDSDRYQTDHAAEAVHVDSKKKLEFVCCGKTFPDHEVGVFDEKGTRLKDRQVGELWVKGPSVCRGYYKDPQTTERTFGGGWLRTGDLGYLVDGNVYVSGRKKDLIIVNGRNYDPQRIEWIVDDLPEVRKGSSVAFSRPGASSEELVVVVETRTQNPDALKERVSQAVTEQMQLTVADVVLCEVGSLPKTSSGKLQRAKTRQQYLDGTVGKEGTRTLGGNAEKVTLAKHVALSLLGRGKKRAQRLVEHSLSIRSMGDAVSKLKLASEYMQSRMKRARR